MQIKTIMIAIMHPDEAVEKLGMRVKVVIAIFKDHLEAPFKADWEILLLVLYETESIYMFTKNIHIYECVCIYTYICIYIYNIFMYKIMLHSTQFMMALD